MSGDRSRWPDGEPRPESGPGAGDSGQEEGRPQWARNSGWLGARNQQQNPYRRPDAPKAETPPVETECRPVESGESEDRLTRDLPPVPQDAGMEALFPGVESEEERKLGLWRRTVEGAAAERAWALTQAQLERRVGQWESRKFITRVGPDEMAEVTVSVRVLRGMPE
jgi:hypothetical protein